MKVGELVHALKERHVPDDRVSILNEGGNANLYDRCCLDFADGVWEVYYVEGRGKEYLRRFAKEEEACRYFLELVGA